MIGVELKPTELREFATHSSNVEIGFTGYCEPIPALNHSPISYKQYLPQLTEIVESKEIYGFTDVSDISEQLESCSNMEPHRYSDGSDTEVYSNNATVNLPYTRSRQVHEYLNATDSSHQEYLSTYSGSISPLDMNGTTTAEKNVPTNTTEATETLYPFTDSSAFIEYDDCKKPVPANMYKMRWMDLPTIESTGDSMEDTESTCYTEKIVEPTESQYAFVVDESDEVSTTVKESTPNIGNVDEMKSNIQLETVEDKPEASHQPKYSKCFLRLVRALQPDLYEYIEDSPEVKQIIKTSNRSLRMVAIPSRKSRSVAKTAGEQLLSEPKGESSLYAQNTIVTTRPTLQRFGHSTRRTTITSDSDSVVSRLYQIKKRALSTQ
nr:hypothetical transcript [Hymenolepis microstoma]